MSENKSRLVLLCQHSLTCAVVVALVAPATTLVTLDIVAPPAGVRAGTAPDTPPSTSVVAATPVKPTVSSVPLRGVTRAGLRALEQPRAGEAPGGVDVERGATNEPEVVRLAASGTADDRTKLTVLSPPQSVDGLATVGVTWDAGADVDEQGTAISVRTRTDDVWSTWTTVPYEQDEGPDAASSEQERSTPGTEPVYVGGVDDVQVKALTPDGAVPAGMRLALVDPGTETAPVTEEPDIDTGRLQLSVADDVDDADDGEDPGTGETSDDAELATAGVTPKPQIFSRAQWGADERMRDSSSLQYGEVHAGFVHHTVNANGYSRAQVPSIMRGIYAYHTQSRGWSDIGYNFLVDRFGRIWEGRFGGVDRPVVGAHAGGYNGDAFGMSAIGNFDITGPSSAMVDAYARLFAWKLSLHGVPATSTQQRVAGRVLRSIQGHRDVGQTACPGRYLYAKLGTMRSLAAKYQRAFTSRSRTTKVAGTVRPAIVARDRSTRQVYLIRTSAAGKVARVTSTGATFRQANLVLNAGDWDGDGVGDVITRSGSTGKVYLYRGWPNGRLSAPKALSEASFGGVRLLSAVGDLTGDGRPDLLGQPSGGSMRIYPGKGAAGFYRSYVAHSAISGTAQLGIGLWNADGSPDSLVRRGDGSLVLYPGNGPGGLTGGTRIGSLSSGYDWAIAAGDVDGDRRPDLVVRNAASGALFLMRGTRTGFSARTAFGSGMGRFDLAG